MPERARHDHNSHYHDCLLALPPRFERALDVGCGTGEFAAGWLRGPTRSRRSTSHQR